MPFEVRRRVSAWSLAVPLLAVVAAHLWVVFPAFGTKSPAWRTDDLGQLAADDELLRANWFRPDVSYQPIVQYTHQRIRLGGDPAWSSRVVDLTLHAAATLLAFGILLSILGDGVIAALGASIFAALPIHADAVAGATGRKELVAGLLLLGMWLTSIRSSAPSASQGLRYRLLIAFGLCGFAGIFSSASIVAFAFFLPLQAWILRRPVPWLALGILLSVAVGYVTVRYAGVVSWRQPVLFVANPLVEETSLSRILNGFLLLGRYASLAIAPVGLSADYSHDMIPVLAAGNPLLWLRALAIVASMVALVVVLRRRAPAISLALAFFAIVLLPHLSIFSVAPTIFRERIGYAAALAFPLALGGIAAAAQRRFSREAVVCCLAALAVVYGGLTWVRNSQWNVPLFVRMTREAPRSAYSHLKEAQAYFVIWSRAETPSEKERLRRETERRIRASLEIHPRYPYAWFLLGRMDYVERRYAEAVEHLDLTLRLLRAEKGAIPEPKIHRWRGESLLFLGRYEEARHDLEVYMRFLEGIPAPPDDRSFTLLGLARARTGDLPGALKNFDAAAALGPGVPEVWSNRGFCRFLLKDYQGAADDYRRGRTLMEQKGILYRPAGESVWDFLRKAADVQAAVAAEARKEGDEEKARAAEEERARLVREAVEIIEKERARSSGSGG